MSIKFNTFEDYSNWSSHWKEFLEFFAKTENIKDKEQLYGKLRNLINDFDGQVRGSYLKDDMGNVSYDEKDFQLAYLLRYYPLYSKTISYIDNDIKLVGECLKNQAEKLNNKNKTFKLNISIFGGGSAPEALNVFNLYHSNILEIADEMDWSATDLSGEIFFNIYDKDDWQVGRNFTKHFMKNSGSATNLSFRFKEEIFDIKNNVSINLYEPQDFIIFQFSLTEMRDLIGADELAKKIEQISLCLVPGGKLLLLERIHLQTPYDFFEAFNNQTKLNLIGNKTFGGDGIEAQTYAEIPKFIKKMYSHSGASASRFNRFMYYVYESPKSSSDIISEGSFVRHDNFGEGKVLLIEGLGKLKRIQVDFNKVGKKWLVMPLSGSSKLKKI